MNTPPSIFNRSIVSESEFKMIKDNQENYKDLNILSNYIVSLKIAELSTLFIEIINNLKNVFRGNEAT